jgi:orotidine-5'-phosphate decarboxylase
VERSARVLAGAGCDLLTVHAEPQVMQAAVKAKGGSDLKILAVTVLTSLNDADLIELGYAFSARDLVARRIRQAVDCGVDGIVSSPHEAALAREIAGPNFLVVTPGVRPFWSAKNDQARAATPADALKAGASHLVCGRPITAANDPREAALKVVAEMAEA